ncbi:MAG: hypothetical protein ACREP3_13170 [Candidatus Binatia bacterium]
MEDRDPIKQLQHLLDDPGKVLERISRIQSALGSINTSSAEAPPATSSPTGTGSIAQTEADTYNSLLQTLRDMQLQIEECLRPLALQAVQAEAERLSEWMKHEQHALDECLARIDQSLLACVERIHESQKKYTDLSALKKRLEDLGASPSSLPELSTSQDPGEIISARLESLRRDGKI